MRRSIHIFLKDARHFRIEIDLFLVVSAIYAWAGARPPYPISGPEWLLPLVAIFLIARVVHDEPIPGDGQFWVTRPYRRMSLAGAKLLFIVAFVCAPICAAQIVMLVAGGFPLLSGLPVPLWSQVLIFFVGSILVAALAAITSGTVLFMLAVLLLTAAGWIAALTFPAFVPTSAVYRLPEPPALGWVRQYVALALLALTGAFVLHRQYRDRATTLSRPAGIIDVLGMRFEMLPGRPLALTFSAPVAAVSPAVMRDVCASLETGALLPSTSGCAAIPGLGWRLMG